MDKLWISYNLEGTPFIVQCDCPEMVLSSPSLGKVDVGDYELVTQYFHVNPFKDNAAKVHFLKVYEEVFPKGIKQMLCKYGRRGNQRCPTSHYTLSAFSHCPFVSTLTQQSHFGRAFGQMGHRWAQLRRESLVLGAVPHLEGFAATVQPRSPSPQARADGQLAAS